MCAKKRTPVKRKKHSRKKKKIVRKPAGKIILLLMLCIVVSLLLLETEHLRRTGNESHHKAITATEGLEIPRFVNTKKEQLIKYKGFTISYCADHCLPNWAGYELTAEKTRGIHERTDRFFPDPNVNGRAAISSDYTNSGYDRGHLVPAADMKWDSDAMAESFYMSNICPQHPDLNRRGWKNLEEKVRDWAVSDSAIIVICGPLMNKNCNKIGKNKISVPDGFFKVIFSPFASPPQAIGFLFKNTIATAPLKSYAVIVDSIEAVTGLDFFHQLPDSLETILESQIAIDYWEL